MTPVDEFLEACPPAAELDALEAVVGVEFDLRETGSASPWACSAADVDYRAYLLEDARVITQVYLCRFPTPGPN